jgi:hypothetical protein
MTGSALEGSTTLVVSGATDVVAAAILGGISGSWVLAPPSASPDDSVPGSDEGASAKEGVDDWFSLASCLRHAETHLQRLQLEGGRN